MLIRSALFNSVNAHEVPEFENQPLGFGCFAARRMLLSGIKAPGNGKSSFAFQFSIDRDTGNPSAHQMVPLRPEPVVYRVRTRLIPK